MNIELAQEHDIDALASLLGVLFEQEAEFSADTERQRQGLMMIIRNPAIGEIVALKKKESIIGMVSLLYTVSTALGARVAWLEDMIIHPDHRHSGAGTALLQFAMRHAGEQGCQRITLLTDQDNSAAQRFYSHNGFERSSMVPMRQGLPVNPR